MPLFKRIIKKLTRKKVFTDDNVQATDLRRCLSTLDLTFLGIGCTLGAGMYVVSGQVAHDSAGPAVVVSFLVAAVASALAAMCYAEFASRIPRAGSAYVYSYVSVGELMAFIIGWNMVLEYVIGTATLSRAWSNYLDSLCDHRISHFFNTTMPMGWSPQLSDYPDLLAVALTFVVSGIVALGVKESALVNNIFTVVNLLVVVYITACGLFKIDWHNWDLRKNEIPASAGDGGFLPYGYSGMMSGAATCFFAFIGFDVIAAAGEETSNPKKSVPIAIAASLFVVFLCYFCVSGVITLMCPYYLLGRSAPLPYVFDRAGWGVARYVISTGAIAGLTTSLLAGLLPLPRILYAMGTDGVIFKFMGKVSPRFQTPIVGTVVSCVFSAYLSMIFNVQELVKMMAIGTLLAYTLVAMSVLILRYEPDDKDIRTEPICHESRADSILKLLFAPDVKFPTHKTARISKLTISFMCIVITTLSAFLVFCDRHLINREAWAVSLTTVLGAAFLVSMAIIHRQPQSRRSAELPFKVPFLPLLPATSGFINVYLMFKLSAITWIRFGVWMAIGFIVYTISGICYASDMDEATAKQEADDITTTTTSSLSLSALHNSCNSNSNSNSKSESKIPEPENVHNPASNNEASGRRPVEHTTTAQPTRKLTERTGLLK